ncbi:hypothetical protein [Ruegeria atlantica]|nr:hypothetical protein [Ruegeria atlantica]
MESELPILLYLFSYALALATLACLRRQSAGRQCVQIPLSRRSDPHT